MREVAGGVDRGLIAAIEPRHVGVEHAPVRFLQGIAHRRPHSPFASSAKCCAAALSMRHRPAERQGRAVDQAAEPQPTRFGGAAVERFRDGVAGNGADRDRDRQIAEGRCRARARGPAGARSAGWSTSTALAIRVAAASAAAAVARQHGRRSRRCRARSCGRRQPEVAMPRTGRSCVRRHRAVERRRRRCRRAGSWPGARWRAMSPPLLT